MEEVSKIVLEQPASESIAQLSVPLEGKRNDRLSAVVAGGQSKKYFGKEYTITEIENISVNERDKLYSRYEAKLGREMIPSLGSSIINLCAKALGSGLHLVDVMEYEFTINNEDDLITDLDKGPFISTALSSCVCEVYYNYGKSLAPVTACLIAAKHFKIQNSCLDNKYDGTGNPPEATRGGTERGDENTERERKKVDVALAVNSTSASSSTEEGALTPLLYKGIVAIGVFTYIVYKKLATPRPAQVFSPSRAPHSPEKNRLKNIIKNIVYNIKMSTIDTRNRQFGVSWRSSRNYNRHL